MGKKAHLSSMRLHRLLYTLFFFLFFSPALADNLPMPIQTTLATPAHITTPAGPLTLQASFDAQVQILSTNMYADDWKGAVAPFDIAVGWGPISQRKALEDLRFTQANRFYYWEIPEDAQTTWNAPSVILHSTNIHIIPSTPELRNRLLTIRAGDKVRLTGYLADAHHPDGLVWLTSLRRDDTGPGACEILYLTNIELL